MFMFKHNMAIKTITVTEDAYESIKALKRPDESFSKLFRRISKEKIKLSDFLGIAKGNIEEDRKRMRKNKDLLNKDFNKRLKYVSPR